MNLMSEEEIKQRLNEWFSTTTRVYPTAMIQGIQAFMSLSEYARGDALDALKEFFCVHCGSDNPNCKCWRDE